MGFSAQDVKAYCGVLQMLWLCWIFLDKIRQCPNMQLVERKNCLITFDCKSNFSTISTFQKEPLLHFALEPFNFQKVSDGVVSMGQLHHSVNNLNWQTTNIGMFPWFLVCNWVLLHSTIYWGGEKMIYMTFISGDYFFFTRFGTVGKISG